MASMELTPDQMADTMAPEPYSPRYAVGETYLRKEALEALGLTDALKPGTAVRLSGVAKVMSSSLDCEGEEAGSLCIQITELDVKPAAVSAKAMFPNSEMED